MAGEQYEDATEPKSTTDEIFDAGMLILSAKLGVMNSNRIFQELLKRPLIPNEHLPLERFFSTHELEQAQTIFRTVLTKGKLYTGIKSCLTDRTGNSIFCTFSAEPLFSETGEIIGVIFHFQAPGPVPKPAAISKYMPPLDYQAVFERLPEGVFTVNTSWRITSFNRTAEEVTGFRKMDVIGKHCWDVFRSDLCQKECPMAESLKTGRTCIGKELSILNHDGCRKSLLVNSSAICANDGSILGAVETFRLPSPISPLPLNRSENYTVSGIIGKSPAMQSIFSMLPDIAASEASVLISGESGTGKDLLARAIHQHSKRGKGPFVAVNCMALAETLLESELFGHEKGAFTGAIKTRPGRFELANGGTLFLDEIGELKRELQVKLLGVLEQRTFERVGGTRSIPLQARIISATNQDLKQLLQTGRFREDLYYRLRTVPITLPPLRERPEDIPLLVDHFRKKFNQKYNKQVRSIDPKVMNRFLHYHWPGNIRELERFMEHAFVFVKGPVIFPKYLPDMELLHSTEEAAHKWSGNRDPGSPDMIEWALSKSRGKRQEAADLLGISRTSLWRKMKSKGLD